jgi:hypothetical protein
MGALSEFGKLGLTCIGNSLEEAETIYQRVTDVLDKETEIHLDRCRVHSSPRVPITWIQGN